MDKKHPSFDIIGTLGDELAGKKIALGITGSVAAAYCLETARLLMRHGAHVFPVMTQAAMQFIGPDLMEYASGHSVVTELTGGLEHVVLAGNVEDKVDLILIAPATANTIGKVACGIDDTPVTTLATTGLGEGIPMIIVPAMHAPMYHHPFVKENIAKLEKIGVKVMQPRLEEGKAKIPLPPAIAKLVLEFFTQRQILKGKKVLVTAGRTVEYLDPIRVFTNNSSGKMGMAYAQAARELGADVTVVYGRGTVIPPTGVKVLYVDTTEDMKEAVLTEVESHRYDLIIAAAAVGDWRPIQKADKKISTHDKDRLVIEMEPTPKIIDQIKKKSPHVFLVAARALHNLPEKELIADATQRMKKAAADMIIVNDVSKAGHGFETDTNEVYLIDRAAKAEKLPLSPKKEIAKQVLLRIAKVIY